MTYPPGLYDGIPDSEYHADDSLSSSGARTLLSETGPADLKFEIDNGGRPPKDEYDFGHAAHKYVLGVGSQVVRVEADSWRTKDAQRAKRDAHAAGKIPMLAGQDDVALEMARKVHAHDLAGGLFTDGVAEQSIYWTDPETGVPLRCRPDYLIRINGRVVLVDYKTSKGSGRRDFAKAAASYGYYIQHPFYTEGVRAIGLDENPGFVFVTQRKTPPYPVTVCELHPSDVATGVALMRRAIEIYAECRATGQWPDDSDQIHTVNLPVWVRYYAEEILNV